MAAREAQTPSSGGLPARRGSPTIACMAVTDRRFLRLLALYALGLLALHLAVKWVPAAWANVMYPQALVGPGGRLKPEEWLWGIYPFTYLPAWLRWTAGVGTATLVVWAGFARDLGRVRTVHVPFPHRRWVQAALAALCLPVFYAGRVVHTRWGDAYLLVKGIADPGVHLTYNWQAPLDTLVHTLVFRVGAPLGGWTDALPAYWWVSSLAGAGAVWVLLHLAADIGQTDLQAWALFGLVATLGAMQLFFGYPENYTLISLLILVYLWLAWRFAQGRASLWAPSLALALANGFHPATLVLQPSLWVLAGWVARQKTDRGAQTALRTLVALVAPPVVVGAAVLALMTAGGHGLASFTGAEAPGGGDHRWLVPLAAPSTKWEYYAMFSRGHVMDILNQQWLSMPFTLPLLLLLAIFYRKRMPRDAYSLCLLVAAAGYVLLTWVWNPDYGGQRDWDLFAVAAWPATLLAAYWMIRGLDRDTLARACLIVVPVQALHTAAWVFSNTRPWEWPT